MLNRASFLLVSLLIHTNNASGNNVKPAGHTIAQTQQQAKSAEAERDRAYARQQFARNFRDLQLTAQRLLHEHEAKTLTKERLAKDAKTINKCAKSLRSLMALGNLASQSEINKDIDTPAEFDESIRRLAQLIWDFAHSPVHQNNKVFNAEQAGHAQTELLMIINLSKAIEGKAKGYTASSSVAQ